MTEHQRLFLVQARSCFAVFELLEEQSDLPSCHSLQHLQMVTELLGKAHAWKNGPHRLAPPPTSSAPGAGAMTWLSAPQRSSVSNGTLLIFGVSDFHRCAYFAVRRTQMIPSLPT